MINISINIVFYTEVHKRFEERLDESVFLRHWKILDLDPCALLTINA